MNCLQWGKQADLTASYTEEKGDINKRVRPREDLAMNADYYILYILRQRKKNVPKRGKLGHKGCMKFIILHHEGIW